MLRVSRFESARPRLTWAHMHAPTHAHPNARARAHTHTHIHIHMQSVVRTNIEYILLALNGLLT